MNNSRLFAGFSLVFSLSFLEPTRARAADLKLLQATLGADGKLQIEHSSDPAAYYILYRGERVVDISFVVDMAFGAQGTGHLSDDQSIGTIGFYRVLQVPLTAPLDTDDDGIDDVYELTHFGALNALDPGDASADPDGDGLTNLEEYKRGTDLFISEYIAPTVNPVESPTRSASVILTGTARPRSQIKVEVNQGATQNGSASANGTYTLVVPLPPNCLNRLFVSAIDTNNQNSSLQPLEVIQDSLPPGLFIDFPTNNSVLTTTNTMIAGRVGDMLSGFLGLSVTVSNRTTLEGGIASVDVGIGNNGTYERGNLTLALGTNRIQVTATDKVGNAATQEITLVRAALSGPRIVAISGDQQKTSVHRRLSAPLIVRAAEADGTTPIANQTLVFQVIRSDGRLLPVDPTRLAAPYTNHVDANANGSLSLELTTDAQGQARVWWTMGGDAGCANNRLQVTMAGVSNTLYFCASATPALIHQINVGSGNNQKTETSATAPEASAPGSAIAAMELKECPSPFGWSPAEPG